jgi:DNA-binding SARP family transcriptional activator
VEFRVLGRFEVVEDARALSLARGKESALLAMLVLHVGHPVSTDQLVEGLWAGRPPANAAKTIQIYVSRLRRRLGKSLIVTTQGGYELAPSSHVDAVRFEQLHEDGHRLLEQDKPVDAEQTLRAALALWRGDPLVDFRFEEFAQEEIARLEELRASAAAELVAARLELGWAEELIPELEALIRIRPLWERPRGQLMLALYRTGRQTDALDAYQSIRVQLREQLGLDPSPELQALERSILNHAPEAQRPRRPGPGDNGPVPGAVPPRGDFVGRERELAALEDALADARAGRGRLVLLVGEPGIGKSRLADELIVQAKARGTRVLIGRCWEAGGAPAYWPWLQALRTHIRETTAEALISQFGADAPDLAQLLPELWELYPDLPEPPRLDPEGARFRLFEATTAFLKRAAQEQPLLVVLDDLHAADEPSLLLLRFVARELEASRLLIVGAYRDIDPKPGETLLTTVSEVAREPVTSILPLGGLGAAEIGQFVELATADVPAADLVEALHAETEGNPLFVVEIVRLLAAEGRPLARRAGHLPQSLKEVISRRLRGLPPACKPVLSLAAVLGREFDLDLLATASGLDRGLLFELLDQAIVGQLVTDVPGSRMRLRFGHVLFRDALYDELTFGRRRELHKAVGEALEQLDPDNNKSHLAELAYHFCEAVPSVDRAKAVDYAQRAGDNAAGQLAPEEAIRLYESALSLVDDHGRPQLLLRLARSLWIAHGTGAERALQARDGFAAVGDLDGAAEAELLLADIRWAEGSQQLVSQHMERAIELVRERPGSRTTANVLSHSSRFHMLADDEDEAITTGRDALAIAEELGLESIRADCLSSIGVARASIGDLEGGMEDLRQAFAIAVAAHDGWQIWRARVNLADISLWLIGDAERAFAEQHELQRLLQTARSGPIARWNLSYDAWECYWRGRWEEALRTCNEFIDWVAAGNHHYVTVDMHCLRALILASRGSARALADAQAAVSLARRARDPRNLYLALAVHAHVATDLDERKEADRLLVELLSLDGPEPYPVYVVPLALAAQAAGRADDVLSRFEHMPTSPWRDAATAMLSGHYLEAAERFTAIGVQPEEAHARLLAAEAFATTGNDAEAHLQLAAARPFFETVGASTYVRRADQAAKN